MRGAVSLIPIFLRELSGLCVLLLSLSGGDYFFCVIAEEVRERGKTLENDYGSDDPGR